MASQPSPPRPAAGERPARGPLNAEGEAGKQWMQRLTEELKLTDDQQKKLQANQKAQMEALGQLRKDVSLTPQDRRAKVRALREENDKRMKALLTKEQHEKWLKLRQEQFQTLRRNRPTPWPEPE